MLGKLQTNTELNARDKAKHMRRMCIIRDEFLKLVHSLLTRFFFWNAI